MSKLLDKDWQKLIRNIERGKCVLLLGADINSDWDNCNLPSLNTLFARKLAASMEVCNLYDPNDLPYVAQKYLVDRLGFPEDLLSEAENFYHEFKDHTTKFHKSLAKLPFSYCISTTPDDLMINAFMQVGKTPIQGFYHFRSGNRPLPIIPTYDSPLVYKLYGAINDNNTGNNVSDSLVLTESDILDFLANIISGRPELPPLLSSLLRDESTSFLFIGFGFQRWYFRVLLHMFRKQIDSRLPWSMALEDSRFFSDPEHKHIAFFYDHSHSIEFKYCSWNEFADSLLERYQSKASVLKKNLETPLSIDAPTLFLCHSSKDSEDVGQLGEKLRKKGFNTWRDRDDLRGGEDWDRKIKHLIENNLIDYFLVLQTPNMLAESQSYFIQEINFALKRQEQNLPGFLFILPVFFSGENKKKLDLISHLNYLDLRQDNQLDRLVQDILDDKQKRQARREMENEK